MIETSIDNFFLFPTFLFCIYCSCFLKTHTKKAKYISKTSNVLFAINIYYKCFIINIYKDTLLYFTLLYLYFKKLKY